MREGTRTGRIPAKSARSVVRAARCDERTDANVASARTSVPPAVANDEMVAQSATDGSPRERVGNDVAMILEHAVLDVIPGQEDSFEQAFQKARPIISSVPGFHSLRLSQCVERPNRYLFLVEWERLEDHMEGFRGSDQYDEWRHLLHHFYDPFPLVEHFAPGVPV
jgi:heme-degrading monooxygenase HmoA